MPSRVVWHTHLGDMHLLMRAEQQAGENISASSTLDGIVVCHEVSRLFYSLFTVFWGAQHCDMTVLPSFSRRPRQKTVHRVLHEGTTAVAAGLQPAHGIATPKIED